MDINITILILIGNSQGIHTFFHIDSYSDFAPMQSRLVLFELISVSQTVT